MFLKVIHFSDNKYNCFRNSSTVFFIPLYLFTCNILEAIENFVQECDG